MRSASYRVRRVADCGHCGVCKRLNADVMGAQHRGTGSSMRSVDQDASESRTHLFVAAGGGGDVFAAIIVQRWLYGKRLEGGSDALPFVATYSWDRLMVDPVPGPRSASWFECLTPIGEHNYLVTAASSVRPPGNSLLPRLARELDTSYYLLDPRLGACGIRDQLRELVSILGITRVSLVDCGGDILSTGYETDLRSPMSDALLLAAADDIGAEVDVIVAGVGLDGELPGAAVRKVVTDLGGTVDWGRVKRRDVANCLPILAWHPSEVNGLLVAAALGYSGVVEIRDAAYRVQVDAAGAAVHRCDYEVALAHNALAKSMIETVTLRDAEGAMLDHQDHCEIDYQRNRAGHYRRSKASAEYRCVIGMDKLLNYGAAQGAEIDALSIRRAAEIMQISRDELEAFAPVMAARCPQHFNPPLWTLSPLSDPRMFTA